MNVPERLRAIIRWVMRDVTYHKHYGCTVQKQTGETVDLLPDDPKLRGSGLAGVPIMHGLPGVSVRVAPGTRMTLFFENGDPQKPKAALWEGGHIQIAFNNGVMPIARVGDSVTINPLGLIAPSGGGPVTGTCIGTIAAGAPTVLA